MSRGPFLTKFQDTAKSSSWHCEYRAWTQYRFLGTQTIATCGSRPRKRRSETHLRGAKVMERSCRRYSVNFDLLKPTGHKPDFSSILTIMPKHRRSMQKLIGNRRLHSLSCQFLLFHLQLSVVMFAGTCVSECLFSPSPTWGLNISVFQ